MKTVFFGCSMRGGYERVSKEELAKFPEVLEELGYTLASKHQTGDWKQSEGNITPQEIHERDVEWLEQSDFGVFEISNPSLGVGGEISDMAHMGKPILCLYKNGLEHEVSAYIRGKQGSKQVSSPFECHPYDTMDDAKKIIGQFTNTYLK